MCTSLKISWHGIVDSNHWSGSQSPLPYHLANPVYNWWLLHLALGIETTKQVRCKHQSLKGKPFVPQHLILTYLVGQAGVDPATPEGNGFTARRSCRFATDPYGGEGGCRPHSRIATPNSLANCPLCHHWVLLHVPVQLYLALNDYWCADHHTRGFTASKTTY